MVIWFDLNMRTSVNRQTNFLLAPGIENVCIVHFGTKLLVNKRCGSNSQPYVSQHLTFSDFFHNSSESDNYVLTSKV